MKPLAAPTVPSNTDWEWFDNGVGMLLNTAKQAFVKQEKKLKRRREKKRGRCQEFCVNGFRLVDDFRLHGLHLSGG